MNTSAGDEGAFEYFTEAAGTGAFVGCMALSTHSRNFASFRLLDQIPNLIFNLITRNIIKPATIVRNSPTLGIIPTLSSNSPKTIHTAGRRTAYRRHLNSSRPSRRVPDGVWVRLNRRVRNGFTLYRIAPPPPLTRPLNGRIGANGFSWLRRKAGSIFCLSRSSTASASSQDVAVNAFSKVYQLTNLSNAFSACL